MIPPNEDESKMLASAMDDEDNSKFADMIDQSIQDRDQSKKGKKSKRENIIDFSKEKVFYEDSEGDLNVISDDEDLINASRYTTQHK